MSTSTTNSNYLLENKIFQQISDRLKSKLNIYQIIVFGSYANRKTDIDSDSDSDIDIIVILNQQGISKTYAEKIKNRSTVTKLLSSIRRTIPLDVLVYTKEEWNLLLKQDSSFINEIKNTGISIS